MIRMCIKDRISSHSSYNLLFSEKIQLHFVLVLWRVIGHPYIESATALSDIKRRRRGAQNEDICHVAGNDDNKYTTICCDGKYVVDRLSQVS